MTFRTLKLGAFAALMATPAWAEITITEAYARASGANAKAGAAFMIIVNSGSQDDRLIAATSDAAVRVELHTHKDMGDGIMKMMEIEDGFAIPAGGAHALSRGGDHIMFMGLTRPFLQGGTVKIDLTFENAGPVTVEIPVDLTR